MVMLVILAWIVVGLGCWIGYHLVQQNGRILLQLDVVEQQLAELQRSMQVPQNQPTMPVGLAIGTPAPAFELPDLLNHRIKLSEWQGHSLLLIFFNPGCGFCQQMVADIAALPFEAKDKPIPVLVSTGNTGDNRKMVEEHGIRCPILLQQQMEVASKYHVTGTPIGYLIDENGAIASEMAIGAPALLKLGALAITPDDHVDEAHTSIGVLKVNHDLTNSKVKRNGLSRGAVAPAFRLPRLNGGELALEEFRGRKLLLLFSDPGCNPCQELSGRLSQVWSPQSEVQILMISRGSREVNQAKAGEHKLAFPIVLQKQWEISRLYAMFATPIAYLINEEGVIASEVATGTDAILTLLLDAITSFREGSRTA